MAPAAPAAQPAAPQEAGSLTALLQEFTSLLQAASDDSSNPNTPHASEGEAVAVRLCTLLLDLLNKCISGKQGEALRTLSAPACPSYPCLLSLVAAAWQHQQPEARQSVLALELTLLRAAKERELLSVVKLVDMALQHYPAMFVKEGCVTLLKLLRLLWPLFASGGLRCAAAPARAAHEQYKMPNARCPFARQGAETPPRRSVHGALADAVASLATLLARGNRGAFRGLVSGVFDLLLGARGCRAPA
jgi:hypothetical protein